MTDPQSQGWASKASYSDLFFRMLAPALLLDSATLEILEANDAAEKALGLSAAEVRGSLFSKWIPEELRNQFEQQVRVTLRRYHPREFEMELEIGEAHRLYRIELCQLQGQDRGHSLLQLIAHDITAQREAEERAEKYLEELKQANEKLQAMSITDELTQVYNLRYFKQRLEIEHQRSVRFKRPYSILFFDIDNFKHYNDRNGHPAGDALLRQLAQLLKTTSRETDCVARYGGEEFVVLAPETNESQGGEFAERLRKTIQSAPFEHSEHQPLGKVSASIGVASYPAAGTSPSEVIQAADQAMYHSKRTGKDRVTLFQSLAIEPS